ncbi:hypothetical protein PSECIP111951_04034 [Pseudoalteromonas holothuriae]|uniref:Uncharacterized protein n=1 Tax=Pseudoalteromonas holothuriae TaxID=2963714 RepID=A0ABM9GPN0_9GAMM|nr:hypothetical protein [Pseudoalteromonas sp. CIP111951]CAH9068135.1 hypothetical protein PSECIP111951_04034 [Pseudoalteromonas sp. CIP111951]
MSQPYSRKGKLLVSSLIGVGATVGIGFLIVPDHSEKLNNLLELSPATPYKIESTKHGVVELRQKNGVLGDFQHCLKSYKPIEWIAANTGVRDEVSLIVNDQYRIGLQTAGRETFTFFVAKYSDVNSWRTHLFAVNCNLNQLNTWSEQAELREIEALDDDSPFKELYISNDNLTLPVTKGRLGRFYSCMKSYEPLGYKEVVAEEGLIKLNLDGGSELQGGHILNLGIQDNKAVSVLIEKYGYRDRTESVSKSYKIDCDLNLLDS